MIFDEAGSLLGDEAAPGQVIFTGTTTWVVPAGVRKASMVVVTVSSYNAFVARTGPFTLCSAIGQGYSGDGSVGDGGGNGGSAGFSLYWELGGFGNYVAGGGGGAGGYSGNGGNGGRASFPDPDHPYYVAQEPTAGTGGAGGGGSYGGNHGGGGGGVGLLGIGSNGAGNSGGGGFGGSGGANGTLAVGPGNALYGGGSSGHYTDSFGGAVWGQTSGGALRYKNNVDLIPGETLTIECPTGGGIRIMWGGLRSYPSNAADL